MLHALFLCLALCFAPQTGENNTAVSEGVVAERAAGVHFDTGNIWYPRTRLPLEAPGRLVYKDGEVVIYKLRPVLNGPFKREREFHDSNLIVNGKEVETVVQYRPRNIVYFLTKSVDAEIGSAAFNKKGRVVALLYKDGGKSGMAIWVMTCDHEKKMKKWRAWNREEQRKFLKGLMKGPDA